MTLLTLGILIFALVHFVPSMAPNSKANAIKRMGEGGYKGIFSLALLGSFALIIFGWRSAIPEVIYMPPAVLHTFALGLVLFAFLLLAVSSRKSRLRRFIRHPQLSGVALWGISHLLMNGDNRSVMLFSGLTLWAVIEIIAINKREGAWIKEDTPDWSTEMVNVIIATVTVAVVVYLHPWLSGLPVVWT